MLLLYEQGLIHVDTYVRLEKSGEWLKLKKSFYWQMVSGEGGGPVFYGYSSLLPKGRPLVARMIDKLLCIFLCISFTIYALYLFYQDYGYLGVWSSVLSSVIFGNIAVLLYAGSQAAFLHLFGRTLGSKLSGFYILTSRLEKLSFFKAFKRQISLAYTYLDKYSKDKAYYKQLGASFWDAKNGVLFSKEPPAFFSVMNLEN